MAIIDDMLDEEARIRAKHGLPVRVVDAALMGTAQELADRIASGEWPFSHDVGGGAARRIASHGFAGRNTAENLAGGQRTAAEAYRTWLASPGHRVNLLSGSTNRIGVGHASGKAGIVWAADYGRLDAGATEPKPGGWWSWIGRLWR